MSPDVDVLVVGAGPTGLTLAAQAQACGARVRIVDRLLDRVHESRALAIQPRTLEVLAGFGVTDRLVAGGNRAVQLRMHVGSRVLAVPLFDIGIDDTAHPYLLFLSQAETERILGEHLAAAGVAVARGAELTGLDGTADGVVCTLRSGEQIHARYVVGCDGAHSTVRQLAGIPFKGAAYPQTFVLADLEADGVEPDAAHVFVSRRGILFFFPLGAPATWRLLAMRPRTDPTPADRPVTLGEVQALADAYTGREVRLHDPVWTTNFRLHHRGAARYRSGRVFLAGDAAHIHSPAGAQGMNTGIQDAINLGWKLGQVARGSADPTLLDTYEGERAPVGRRVLRFTDRAFTVATSTNPVVGVARTWLVPFVLPLALRFKAGRAYGFRTVSQLAINYRGSPLSTDGPAVPRRGPMAGDRLPDAPIEGGDRTLHRALRSPGWHLLLCGPAAWPDGVVDARVTLLKLTYDDAPDALRRLGLSGTEAAHFLVRPDGHIGYRGGTDLAGLHAYLNRWLVT